MMGLGAVNSTNGILVKPICDSLGFSRGEFTFHRAVITLVGAAALPFYNRICQKIGIKRLLLISGVSVALLTAAYAMAEKLWQFYLIAFINGLFVNGPSFLTVGILINNWFIDKKGLATGLAFCGAGFGGAVLIPVVGKIEEVFSWQMAYLLIGAAILITLLPATLFLVKESPEEIGVLPYRQKMDGDVVQEASDGGRTKGMSLRQAALAPSFWLVIVAFFLLSIIAGAPNIHTAAYLTDYGYSTAFSSAVLSLMMAMHMMGNSLLGGYFDRFGILSGTVLLGCCCLAFPVIILAGSGSEPLLYLFTIIYGVASSGFCVTAPVFITNFFGDRDFSAILSMVTLSTTIGSAAAGPLMGAVYDASGSYKGAWVMLLVFGAVVTFFLLGAYLLRGKKSS